MVEISNVTDGGDQGPHLLVSQDQQAAIGSSSASAGTALVIPSEARNLLFLDPAKKQIPHFVRNDKWFAGYLLMLFAIC
jgi:hypothetical protein